MDIVATFDEHGAVLPRLPSAAVPTIVSDPAARLLFIWGRRPGGPEFRRPRVRLPSINYRRCSPVIGDTGY